MGRDGQSTRADRALPQPEPTLPLQSGTRAGLGQPWAPWGTSPGTGWSWGTAKAGSGHYIVNEDQSQAWGGEPGAETALR